MSFFFTFSFSVSGLRNPFSAARQPRIDDTLHPLHQAHASASTSDSLPTPHISRKDLPPVARRPSPLPTPSAASLSRKRGWESSSSSPSKDHLYPPAKHRAMEDSQQDVAQEPALDELPPVKRRRTLAGTIVSTAVSAVLIGTAVGLTAYRLWRDRGQEFAIEASPGEDPEEPRESHEDSSDMGPPPPYHAEDYHRSRVAPPSPKPHRRAQAPHHSSAFKRPTNTQRRRVAAAGRHHQASASSQSSYLSVPTRPEFDFRSQPLSREGDADVEMDVEGDGGAEEEVQLDRLGAQMEALLNAGRAALRSEVVVASEDPQDAVDDGGGDWVEDELPAAGPSNLRRPRSGSLRRPRASSGTAIGGSLRRQHRPQELRPPPAYSTFNQNHSTPTLGGSVAGPSSSYGTPSPTSSPRSRTFAGSQPGSSVNEFSGLHAPFTTPPRRTAAAGRSNDAESWASPELRASMELARARYRR